MSKYDKTIEISHEREEEGTYSRREVEPSRHYSSKPVTTYHTERYLVEDQDDKNRTLVNRNSNRVAAYSSDEGDNYEEWTTSKRKVNHKTRQVETRVSRQLLVENGKVIADSGPQVTTKIKEDNRVEECEKEKTPKNKSRFQALEDAPEGPEGSSSGRVLGEKKEIQKVSREVREENMQYHDERLKELTGRDVHQKAIRAPHELIAIDQDKHHSSDSAPRGKMVHYSNKGKIYKDTDEILEVAKLAIDGSITKEVKRTNKHEEFSEDEKPDEKGEAEELRHKPVVQRSSRRHADYVNDFDDLRTPDTSDNDEREHYDSRGARLDGSKPARRSGAGRTHKHGHDDNDDQAFPRYDLDPLLNSLHDDDFKPATSNGRPDSGSSRHHFEEPRERRRGHRGARDPSSSDDEITERRNRQHVVHETVSGQPRSGQAVEIPEEYRVNRQRLMASKSGYQSPSRSHSRASSTTAHKSSHGRSQRKEDAAVQAHLTDEEIERHSIRSSLSGGARTQAKTTQHLQRQSTPNASRRYYYGNAATANGADAKHQKGSSTRRRASVSSTSSASSMSSLDERRSKQRQQGTRSRDSGFKSPTSRTETPLAEQKQHQIYSVSKRKSDDRDERRAGATSPTPTTGSVGQRSVKTTTRTLSAGLADRPDSRSGTVKKDKETERSGSRSGDKFGHDQSEADKLRDNSDSVDEVDDEFVKYLERPAVDKRQSDTISVSSLKGPNATRIKVPYRHVIEVQKVDGRTRGSVGSAQKSVKDEPNEVKPVMGSTVSEKSSSEMSFHEEIERLSNRLASISAHRDSNEYNTPERHFEYKTVTANIDPMASKSVKQVINTYNARLEQNSPFQTSSNFNQMESANNNQIEDFSPSEYYVKYRATPVLVDESNLLTGRKNNSEDDDRSSCCSLQSSKTYKIRTIELDEAEKRDKTGEIQSEQMDQNERVEFDENGNSKKPAAWIYDPRDGSSTAIIPPKRPETPKVDSKTEELVQSRGGRSYYLEILDEDRKKSGGSRDRPALGSVDSLYHRWNSQGALNTSASSHSPANAISRQTFQYRPLTPAKTPAKSLHRSTKQLNTLIAQQEQNRDKTFGQQKQQSPRRQLPFGGPISNLGDKAKSSSCLLTVTRPSKYSIYGGFRRPDETQKPVPRLSYSRAIGPRSQRSETQSKTPSRYLKMR